MSSVVGPGFKHRLRERFDTERFRGVLRLLVDVVIRVEVSIILAIDRFRERPRVVEAPTLTVVVKTHERPRQLRRLIRSVMRLQPEIRIIVADDSHRPIAIPGVEVVDLPFNSGVSAGKNAALACVTTPYVLLLDDDFVVTTRTDLAGPIQALESHAAIDIVGGVVVNLPDFSTSDYSAAGLFPTDKTPVHPPGSVVGGYPVRLKVPNFFIARTDSLRAIGWIDELKFIDHLDFFTRACGRLTTVQAEDLVVLHARNPFDRGSAERRENVRQSWEYLNRTYSRNSAAGVSVEPT